MEDFVPTRGSIQKRNATKDFMSVHYEAPKKKAKKNVEQKDHIENSTDSSGMDKQTKAADLKRQQEIEMKRARYDVMKFGMSGFDKGKAMKAKIAHAVSLGAKPPKNRRVNYKVLKAKKKRVDELEKKRERASGLDKSLIKHKPRKTFKKKSDGILDVYGKVGKDPLNRKKN